MSAFSGETTTTSELDGKIFTFRATSTTVWYGSDHPRSPSTQTCLVGLKKKQGLELLLTQFFLSFHRRGNPKRKKNKLYNSTERVMFNNVGSINDSRINAKKCASRNRLKLWSANTARSIRCNTAIQDR